MFTVTFVHEASRWKNQVISFVVWFFQATFTSLIFTNVLFVSDMFGSFRNVTKTGLSSVLTRSIHSVPKKRFYKNVSVVQNNSKFEINLGRNQDIWLGIYISLVNWTENLASNDNFFFLIQNFLENEYFDGINFMNLTCLLIISMENKRCFLDHRKLKTPLGGPFQELYPVFWFEHSKFKDI